MTLADDWGPLVSALERLGTEGKSARFWLRDDDAIEPTAALERLLELARRHGVPVALAVIPARASAALAERLAAEPLARVLVHGWTHANHAPPDEKKQEFGGHRPKAQMIADLDQALQRMRGLFGDRLSAVFVPPWNRIDMALLPDLRRLGYDAVSAFGSARPNGAIKAINALVDPVDWRGTRGCRPLSELALEVARFAHGPESVQTIGILTHHLVHDEAAWAFLAGLFEVVRRSGAASFVSIDELANKASG